MTNHAYLPNGSESVIFACQIFGGIVVTAAITTALLFIALELKYGKSLSTKYAHVILSVSFMNALGSLFTILMYTYNDDYLSTRLSIGASLARGHVIIAYLFWMAIRTEPFLEFHPYFHGTNCSNYAFSINHLE